MQGRSLCDAWCLAFGPSVPYLLRLHTDPVPPPGDNCLLGLDWPSPQKTRRITQLTRQTSLHSGLTIQLFFPHIPEVLPYSRRSLYHAPCHDAQDIRSVAGAMPMRLLAINLCCRASLHAEVRFRSGATSWGALPCWHWLAFASGCDQDTGTSKRF